MSERYDDFCHTFCTNDELTTVTVRICTEVETNLPTDEFLTTETGKAKSESDIITTLKGRSKAGEFTEAIELSDKKRDRLLRVIKRRIKNDIDMEDIEPDAAAGARLVRKLMNENPVDARAGYSEESAQINTLLSSSKKPVYADAIAEGTESLFIALANEQAFFENLIHKQAKANSEVPTGEVKKHVDEMVYRLQGILSYLARKAESHSSTYETAAANIEEIITKIMIPARARATRLAAEREAAKSE